jgi:hypothetical protein
VDVKGSEIIDVALLHCGNQCLLGTRFLAGTEHDRRAMRVVGADEDALVPSESLEPDPNVGLDVLHQMAKVDFTVGIRQCCRDQDLTLAHAAPSTALGAGLKPRSARVSNRVRRRSPDRAETLALGAGLPTALKPQPADLPSPTAK